MDERTARYAATEIDKAREAGERAKRRRTVTLTVTVDVDPVAWREEYGTTETLAEIKLAVRDMVRGAAEQATTHLTPWVIPYGGVSARVGR